MRKLNLPVAVLKADGAHIGDLHIPANLITPDISVEPATKEEYELSLEVVVSGVDIQSGKYNLQGDKNEPDTAAGGEAEGAPRYPDNRESSQRGNHD